MKRSRTCLNLVELDAPAAPKRTCSLPNIGGYKNAQQQHQHQHQHQHSVHRDSLLFFRQQAASLLAEAAELSRTPPTSTAMEVERAFVVDSIVRSQGSLNEITIFEGRQFIGEESGDVPSPVPQSCAVQPGAPGMSLFGGAVIGGLFDDSGDSSDYFFGAASSDEAEEDSSDKAGATVATPAAVGVGAGTTMAASVQDTDSDNCRSTVRGGSGGGGANFARQVSDTDSNISCARQISDASSSSSSSGGSGSSSGGGGGGYSFGGEAEIGVAAAFVATTGAVHTTPAEPSRSKPFRECGDGGGCDDILPVPCESPLAGGRWRRPAATTPRVRVRISSARGTVTSGGSRRQRSMTVPPPWPLTAGPHNRWQKQRRLQQRAYRGGEEEDGSLESADGSGLSEDAKMLLGMDRLRLFDPETASY